MQVLKMFQMTPEGFPLQIWGEFKMTVNKSPWLYLKHKYFHFLSMPQYI